MLLLSTVSIIMWYIGCIHAITVNNEHTYVIHRLYPCHYCSAHYYLNSEHKEPFIILYLDRVMIFHQLNGEMRIIFINFKKDMHICFQVIWLRYQYTHTHTHTHTHGHTHTHTHGHTHGHTHTHMDTHTDTHTHAHTCTHAQTQNNHISIFWYYVV